MWLIIYLLPDNQNFLQSQSLVRTCSVMMPYLPWPSFNKLSKVRKTYKETLMMEAKFLNASDNTMCQQVTAPEDHGLFSTKLSSQTSPETSTLLPDASVSRDC